MKRVLLFVLAAVLLALPLTGAFAGFADDMAWFRNMYDQLPNFMDEIPDYTLDDFYNSCDRFYRAFLNSEAAQYDYYLIVPSFVYIKGYNPAVRLQFSVFASNEDNFVFSLHHVIDTLDNGFKSTVLDDYPDFDDYAGRSYRYHYSLVPVSFPEDCYYYSIHGTAKNFYVSSSEFYNNYDYLVNYTSDCGIDFIYSNMNFGNSGLSIEPTCSIASIDTFVDSAYSTASIRYQSQGEDVDDEVSDFFSLQSLTVIISTEATYLGRMIHRAATVLSICGVGLTASLIGLEILPKVLGKFL